MNENRGAFWNGGYCEDGGSCENDVGLDWNTGPGGSCTPCIRDGGGANGDGGCAHTEVGVADSDVLYKTT